MKKTITTLMLLLTVAFLSIGQDVKPISPLFKNLQSPSFSFMVGGNPWIYKGSSFNPNPWTELAGWTNVKDTLTHYWNKNEITPSDTTRWGASGIDVSGKEDKANKENTTVSNDTIKYPTVNLLKTYADTKAPLTLFDKFQNYLIYWNGTKFAYSSFRETESIDYRGSLWAGYRGSPYYGTSQYLTVDIGSTQGAIRISGANSPILGGTGSTPNLVISRSITSQAYGEKPNLLNYVESFILDGNTGAITLPDLASTNTRPLAVTSTGKLTPIDLSTGTLSGTNVTWDYSVKKNYNITLTGNTIVTITNVSDGDVGTLYVTNAVTAYTITFAGYVNSIDPDIKLGANVVETAGGLNEGDYTFKCHGSTLKWNGIVNRTGN